MSLFGALRSRSTESARPRRMLDFPCLSRTLSHRKIITDEIGAARRVQSPRAIHGRASRISICLAHPGLGWLGAILLVLASSGCCNRKTE